MVVLINHLSASASELLTQALQESNRAWIVGQRSFGKGIGQTAIELGAASSLGGRFWLTHLVFYGLSGQTVQPKGLEPDLAIIDEKVERFRNECESKKRQCRSQSMSASLKQIPERERISPQTISAHPEYKGQRSLQTIHALKDSLSAEVKNELDPQLAAAQRLLQQAPSLISPE
jgi:C-terminal processing protease CtpA/Prc